MMGAGNAGFTKYNTNVNMNTCGGDKKQGIPSRVGLDNWANPAIQILANGSVRGRSTIFTMNQLGGVGAGRSQFQVASSWTMNLGGVRRIKPYYVPLKY
jgi:hypothetical protein